MAYRLSSGIFNVLMVSIIFFSTMAGCSGDFGSKAEKMANAIWNKFMSEDVSGKGIKLASSSQFKFFLTYIKQDKTVDELHLHFQRDKAKAVVQFQKGDGVGDAWITPKLTSITVKMDGEEQTVSHTLDKFMIHLHCTSIRGVMETSMAISITARGFLKVGSGGIRYDCLDLLEEQMGLAVFSKAKALLLGMPEGERCGENIYQIMFD